MLRRVLAPLALAFALALVPLAAPADEDPLGLMEAGHWKRARPLVEGLAKSRPDDALTLYLLARLEHAQGHREKALELAERAAAKDPASARYRYGVAECVGSMAQRAGPLKQLGLAKRFKREAEAALALDPRHVDAREGLIEFHSVAPGIAGGNDRRAAALADTLVTIDPVAGRLAQATLATRAKQDDRAFAALRQALAAGDGYPARMGLARWHAADARKQYADAESHARAARDREPGRVGGWVMLAHLLTRQQRWSDLDALLAEAERAVPDNRTPCFQAARTMIADGREPARAERLLRRYLEQEPEWGMPTHATARWQLALALEKQDRRPEALTELEKALALDPVHESAKKELKRMKRG